MYTYVYVYICYVCVYIYIYIYIYVYRLSKQLKTVTFFPFNFFLLFWSVVDLQYCVSFKCTTK